MVLYENMKSIEHVLLHHICVLSHLMCACKHCNVKLSLHQAFFKEKLGTRYAPVGTRFLCLMGPDFQF